MKVDYDQMEVPNSINAFSTTQVTGITVRYSCSPLNALIDLPVLYLLRKDVECIIINEECYYKKDQAQLYKAIQNALDSVEDPTRGDTSFQLIHDPARKILEVVLS